MGKSHKADDLLKLLGQRTPSAPAAAPKPQGAPSHTPAQRPARRPKSDQKPKGTRGKAIQFYLHEADEKLIREFAVWLAPHRKRINDSLVIKAALRAAKTGPGFLAGYDEGLAVSKAHRKPK